MMTGFKATFPIAAVPERLTGKHSGRFIRSCGKSSIQDEQTQVVLCHYPIANWYNQYRFAVHLYGHVHNNKDAKLFQEYLNLLRANNVPFAAYNVGCMMPYMDYTPRTILEIMKSNLIKKK